jgi:hypothetical protein
MVFSCILYKKSDGLKYTKLFLPVISYGCETWSYPKWLIYIEGVWEQYAEKNMWT